MKRDDETLLEYLIRIAKEKGEDFQQAGVTRLRESRPDAARRQGLMPDQLDIVQDDYMTQGVQDSLPLSATRTGVVDSYPKDRAALEAISQWSGVGPAPEPDPALMQRMLTQPSATDLAIANWTGTGQAPGEDPSLMQRDLEQTRAREQARSFDQVTPGPITPRVPAADVLPSQTPDLELSPIPSVPGTGDPVQETESELSGLEYLKSLVPEFSGGLLDQLKKGVPEESMRASTSFEDLLRGVFGARKGSGSTPGHLMSSGIGGEVYKMFRDQVGYPDIEKASKDPILTESVDLGVIAQQVKEKFTGEKEVETDVFLSDFNPERTTAKVDTSHVESVKKQNSKKDRSKTSAGDQSPVIAGQFTDKKDYYSMLGIPKSISGDLDKIDKEYNTLSMIAMLGGAGNSRAAENYRRKSVQRLRLESEMGEREWQRAYKLATTPLITWHWHDLKAGVLPISLPKGVHPGDVGYAREGFMQTKPQLRGGEIDWAMYDTMYDGSSDGYTQMIYKYANDNYGAMMQAGQMEEALNMAAIPIMSRYPKKSGARWWSPGNKQQLIQDIKDGKKGAVIEAIKMIGEYPKELEDALKEAFPDLFK